MNSFRTPLTISPTPLSIQHQMKGLAIGSCFVEHIGGWLQMLKFDLVTNPFGITYNPVSIAKQLSMLLNEAAYPVDQLFQYNELWHTFDHHSQFSGLDKQAVTSSINNKFTIAKTQLNQAKYILITFGTANIYKHKTSNQIVSNCHKIPNTEFDKKRLSVKEIMTSWEPILQQLTTDMPGLKIIFTVSPIRHLKDGIIENQRSKGTLLLAIDNLTTQFDSCTYFPSYEIMMDDLRDYRFYEKDMIHPNEVAIDYIKEKFSTSFFDTSCKNIVNKVADIQSAVAHKAFHPDSERHQAFLKSTLGKIEGMEKEYGFDFSDERKRIGEG